jgi:hypothetical protein
VTIFDDIYALFYQLMDYIAELFYTFINWMTSAFASIIKFINDLLKSMQAIINGLLAFVEDLLADLIGQLTTFLDQLIDQIANAFATAWNIVRDTALSLLNAIAAFANQLFANVKAQISAIMDQIKGIFADFVIRIEQVFVSLVSFIQDSYNSLVAKMTEGLQAIFNAITDVLTTASNVVNEALATLVAGPASLFEVLSTRFQDIAGAFREKISEVVTGITGLQDAVVQGLIDASDNLLKALADWTNAPELAQMQQTLSQLQTGQGEPVQYQQFIQSLFSRFSPESSLARGVVFILLIAVALVPAGLNTASIYAQPMLQALAREFPYALLAPADAVTAFRKELITRTQCVDFIRRQGYSQADADTFISLSDAVPTEDIVLGLWHRDLVTEAQVDEALHSRGFTAIWRERFKQASFIIPPIQDLIVMAVREVFSPEVAQKFGQFEDFPEDFAEWAERQGLTKDWAIRYWGAHWALPSAMQGFEMLHRGLITADELKLLLRSQDVMPFWRDKLIQIAYLPYTRVDIRRMHQLGVLSDDDVLRAHLDLGYEQEKAERLTQFVLRLNRNAPGEDDAELGRISRTSVLAFYRDGLLPRSRASELLISLGLTGEAASLYLDSIDSDEERAERKAETDIIIAQAEAGTISFAEAQDKLNSLGLETREVEKALTRLARSEKARIKLPSREDGENFLRLGVLGVDGYRDLLLRIGYSPSWADIYVRAFLEKARRDAIQG